MNPFSQLHFTVSLSKTQTTYFILSDSTHKPMWGGCLGTSAQYLHGALWNWRTECLQLVLRVTWTAGETKILSVQWSWAWGPMFWYRSRGQIRGRKWFSSRHSGKLKGPEMLFLASQKIRSKLPRASFLLLTLDHRFPTTVTSRKARRNKGTYARQGHLLRTDSENHVRSQSPLL